MSETPRKALSLLDSVMLIMGSMIGSGIFIVSAGMARDLHSSGVLILAWLVSGFMTVVGALSYGELAAMMPKAGGQYVYLNESYSPLVGFMYGWTLFSVIQTGTIAAVSVAFARFTGVFFEGMSADNYLIQLGFLKINAQQVLGILVVVTLTLINFRGIRTGAMVQNIFTFTKMAALVLIIGMGGYLALTQDTHTAVEWDFSKADFTSLSFLGIFFAAMVGSLFSADSWNNITFTAGEVKNPQRNLPLSLILGTGIVSLIYVLVNVIYVNHLNITEIAGAPSDRVATALMDKLIGSSGVYFIAALVMVSTFGCINGLILSGGRVYYAMAKDRLFFKQAARLNRNDVPANALAFQCLWACLLVLSGSYGELLDYVMFATVLFYILTIGGIFILRSTRPSAPRPYRVWGYPVLPALYILLATGFCISALYNKPTYAYRGLGIVLLGIPIYYIIRASLKKEPEKVTPES